ncbi:hypothetical protein [Pygmaiobacter massiliensis]|uniref:hypothetical protein n=1 Tax=Pygmaiobacter massiliensis TaxID=1917873 RepID=UPI002A8096E4|nr:hypothetical protein [Pygmaiobacter massiliensis]MDY4784323.1 hypothetical protein [Pygmaiobacter massiliensis]
MWTQFNGWIMNRDLPVARIENDRVVNLDEQLAPLYISRTKHFEGWLEMRAIDQHRPNSRLLKKALRLAERDDISTVLSVNAVTITDSYWVREDGSSLCYDDVRFKVNMFDRLALRGDFDSLSQPPSRTPELTNIGSYEKCWRLEDGEWWLWKAANKNEMFSELFISYLGASLGFEMAEYRREGEYVKSRDFTQNATVNFEPAFSLMHDNEDYTANYKVFKGISQALADQYVEILIMDTLCLNADRHTQNYGVLRDRDTGKILCMAPNFDNNIALISRGYASSARQNDLMVNLFNELEQETGAVSSYLQRHPLPIVTPELIERCCKKTNIDVDVSHIQEFILSAYRGIGFEALQVIQQVAEIER